MELSDLLNKIYVTDSSRGIRLTYFFDDSTSNEEAIEVMLENNICDHFKKYEVIAVLTKLKELERKIEKNKKISDDEYNEK